MKQINVYFEDKEHEEITKIKEKYGGNWHDFILELIKNYDLKKYSDNMTIQETTENKKNDEEVSENGDNTN